MSRSVKLDTESLRERQARAQEADRISHDDPTNDPEGRALVQAIHDRKRKAAMTTETPAAKQENGEECLPCKNPKALVKATDNIPLCGRHWNSWLAKYDPMCGDEPPCGAHLITASRA